MRVWRVHVCSILQQQFQATDAAGGTAVVQRSDAIDVGSIHLDTHTIERAYFTSIFITLYD